MLSDYSDELHSNLVSSLHNLRKLLRKTIWRLESSKGFFFFFILFDSLINFWFAYSFILLQLFSPLWSSGFRITLAIPPRKINQEESKQNSNAKTYNCLVKHIRIRYS